MITQLSVDISNDPITGLKRKLVHHKLVIEENLEMTSYRKIVYYEKLDGDQYGRPITQVIAEDESLKPEAKAKLLERYESKIFGVTTQGAKVDPQTGQPSTEENAIQELDFWQQLPIAFIQPTPTTNAGVVYGLLQMSMKSADNNGRV